MSYDLARLLAPSTSGELLDADFRLINSIAKCHAAGVITDRQQKALEGVTTRTDPREVLRVLSCKR